MDQFKNRKSEPKCATCICWFFLFQLGEGSETGDKKADGLCMEFSAVLVSQLESQRQYFEAQLETLANESAIRISAIEKDLERTKASLAEVETKLATVTKEKNLITHKLEKVGEFFAVSDNFINFSVFYHQF